MANKYIDAGRLRAEIENYCKECEDSYGEPGDNNFPFGKVTACHEIVEIINSLQQGQLEVDLEKEYQEFCKDYPFPWSSQYVNREYIDELCLSVARHFYGLRNRILEEAARNVYESWMGGAMNDVRRDMVELGKVLNARKEENK